MSGQFVDVSLIVILAAALGLLAHFLRQPTILAYLLTGVIVSSFGFMRMNSAPALDVMATFGITFLLFTVGLEMRFNELRSIGKTILITSLGHLLLSCLLGFVVCQAFGFSILPSAYIAIALAFSSTIVIIKLLSEKRDLQSLYGRIMVGFLLVQDVVAILLLVLLAGFSNNSSPTTFSALIVLLKAVALFAITLWLSRKVIPKFLSHIIHNTEMIFIGSIAWAFFVALLVSSKAIGFSVEIGGFLAGLALANSAEQFQITSRIKPLRDFFIVIFFIMLGSKIVITQIGDIILPALLLIVLVVCIQPFIVMAIMGRLGYKNRTSFMAGMAVGQVSEFSLLLIAVGSHLGHINMQITSIVTLVAVASMIISSYMIKHSEALFSLLKPYLTFLEKSEKQGITLKKTKKKNHIVLIGAHRMGQYLLKTLPKKRVSIIEFDPVIARQLTKKGNDVIFGDILDPEVIEAVQLKHAALVISTVPHLEENLALIDYLHALPQNQRPPIIVTSQHAWELKMYYQRGATYVLFPHFVGAQHIATLIQNGFLRPQVTKKIKSHDLSFLQT